MKKRNTFLCCMLILIFTFIIPIQATAYDYNESDVIIDFLPGDIDNNQKVNSADARLCLRAAANLETLTDKQIKSVDFDGTGKINSAKARLILRAAAKLDTLSYTVNVKEGQKIVIGPYRDAGSFRWAYSTDSEMTSIDMKRENNLPEGHVGNFDIFFTIVTEETNSFNISMLQECPWTKEINNAFNLTVIF